MENNTPLVSIAMTTYNGEKYISEQLNSILQQDYKNIEIIVCDDCSNDKTKNILNDFQAKFDKIKIYHNIKNLGYKKNFEKAISLCSGDYIALSDQDDIWTINHISLLLENIGECDLICGNQRIIDQNGVITNHLVHNKKKNTIYYEPSVGLYKLLCYGSFLQGASMLLRTSFLRKKGVLPIPEDIPDHDTWFTACGYAYGGVRFLFDVVTLFRRHNNNASFYQISSKKTLSQNIKRFFCKYNFTSNKLLYINAMTKYLDIDKDVVIILNNSQKYIEGMLSNNIGRRLYGLSFYWKYYKYIYFYKNNKNRFFAYFLRLY